MTGVPTIPLGHGFIVYLHWASRKFADPADVWTAMWAAWNPDLGNTGNLQLLVGAPPKQWPGSYAHVFVGVDLDWYTDKETKQKVAGVTSHQSMHIAPGEIWSVRGAWVDDRYCKDATELGKLIGHEGKHLFGLSHADMDSPDWLKLLQTRTAMARAWSQKLVATGAV